MKSRPLMRILSVKLQPVASNADADCTASSTRFEMSPATKGVEAAEETSEEAAEEEAEEAAEEAAEEEAEEEEEELAPR